MKSLMIIAVSCVALATFSVSAASQNAATSEGSEDLTAREAQGMQVYDANCDSCHGPGLGLLGVGERTGVTALRAKYDGRLPPVLTDRTDLNPAVVALFVRQGVSIMPFYRKTEISDDELEALGLYLSRNNPDFRKR